VAKKSKSRTPAPPRPVQSPKRRVQPKNERRRRWYLIAAAATVLVLGLGFGSFVLGGGDGAREALAAAGCTREAFPSQGARHVTEVPEGFEYNSRPATSGPHEPNPLAPAVWGTYDEAVPELKLIHNLEHGGIVIQYGPDVPAATVDQMLAWYREDPDALVVAPLPEKLVEEDESLSNRVTLTAWTYLQTCARFDEEAFSNFVDLHRGNGPEAYPIESLSPGAQ
jgi:Protein of unknown function (DUF3105)